MPIPQAIAQLDVALAALNTANVNTPRSKHPEVRARVRTALEAVWAAKKAAAEALAGDRGGL